MVTKFEAAMAKLATLGQNPDELTDCSEVIPVPANVQLPAPTLPAGKSLADVEAAVSRGRSLSTGARPLVSYSPVDLPTVRRHSVPRAQRRARSRYQRCSRVAPRTPIRQRRRPSDVVLVAALLLEPLKKCDGRFFCGPGVS